MFKRPEGSATDPVDRDVFEGQHGIAPSDLEQLSCLGVAICGARPVS